MTLSARTLDDFASLFQYNRWATGRILETLQSTEGPPARGIDLLSHLLRAQDVWFGRVRETEHAELALWVEEDLAACAERAESSAERWRGLLDACSSEDLNEPIAYTNSSGTAFETPLRDIMSHVINHGTHHRAQIALVLREAAIAPPATDYIFYVREN